MINHRDNLIQKVLYHVSAVARMASLVDTCEFNGHHINKLQVDIIFQLAKSSRGQSVKELASCMHVTNGAITQSINDLVVKRIVKREHASDDRRIVHMMLTQDAQRALAQFMQNYFLKVRPFFDSLSTDDIRILNALLEKLSIET